MGGSGYLFFARKSKPRFTKINSPFVEIISFYDLTQISCPWFFIGYWILKRGWISILALFYLCPS
jgi:hypothetical protein